MDIVIYVVGAVVFFALIMTSIALHEIGHLIPGKIFDVKTTQYFVGFGKTLWSRRRGETEYGVKAIPLGGYVRFVGMYPPSKQNPNQVRAARTGIFQSLADQARAAEWEEIRPEDDGRLFFQKKSWQKLIIMASGPMMNIVLAFLILLGVSMAYGNWRSTTEVAAVSECVIAADQQGRECTADDPDTPAAAAGIEVGDRIVAFNGVAMQDWEQVSESIRANRDGEARITVERDRQQVELTPVHTMINGVRHEWDPSRTVEAGFLGVSPVTELQRGGPVVVLNDMWDMTQATGHALLRFPLKVYQVAADLVTGEPRDKYGPMSIVGASRAAGEIASTDRLEAADKVATVMSLLGSVNLFVALFNFVPLMPLDGGHIAGALYEAVRRRLAKLFGRPDPGFADTAKMLPVAYLVGGTIAIFGVVLILADFIDPIRLL